MKTIEKVKLLIEFEQMDDLILNLEKLVKSKRLQPAERIICDSLVNYEIILPSTISDSYFDKLENLLISLLHTNKGDLSVSCSVRIASCLVSLYKTDNRIGKTWNLFTDVGKRPYKASIYAAGYVTKLIGTHSLSMIAGFAKGLLSLPFSQIQPVLYSITMCFKKGRRELTGNVFIDKSSRLAMKGLTSNNEITILLSIRLLRTILKSKINFQKIYPNIKFLLDNEFTSPFIVEEIGFLLAKLMIHNLKDCTVDEKSKNDFQLNEKKDKVGDDDLKKCFSNLLRDFPDYIHLIFHKFLVMISPSYINKHLMLFFKFICKNIPEEIVTFINLISFDNRRQLFQKTNKENKLSADTLYFMRILAYDEESTDLTAALAFQMSTKPQLSLRESALSFFTKIALRSPELASQFVQTSTIFLSNPPEAYQNLNREIKCLSMVAATIICHRPELAYDYRENIETAISKGLKATQVWNGAFQSAFTLMCVVPSSFFSLDDADHALELFSYFYENNTILSENVIQRCSWLASTVAQFIVQYPKLKNSTRALTVIYTNDALPSTTTNICMLKCFSEIEKDERISNLLGRKIRSLVNTSNPPVDFVFSNLKNGMMSPLMLVKRSPEISRDIPKVFLSLHSNVFSQNAIAIYPDYILSLPADMGKYFVELLYTSQYNYQIAPSLILSLLKNPATASLFHDDLLDHLFTAINATIEKNQTNSKITNDKNILDVLDINVSLRIQTFSECIALYTQQHQKKYLNDVLSRIINFHSIREKCFLLAAIFGYIKDLPEDIIITILLDLNNLALSTEYTVYAVYSLMVLYQQYIVQLSLSSFTANQVDFFFNLFQQEKALCPYIMYYMAQAFNALLLILSPEMNNSTNNPQKPHAFFYNLSKNVILSFANSEVPYSKGVYFHVLRAAFAFAKDLVINENLAFPKSRGTSLSCKTAACGVFADYAKMIDTNADFFSLIPHVLMILQITGDSRATEFINVLVSNFVNIAQHNTDSSNAGINKSNESGNEKTNEVRNRLKEWVSIIKSCNMNGTLPGTDVGACDNVKKCCMNIAQLLLPVILETSPFMSGCIDDIIASTIRSLQSENLRSECFILLDKIFDTFSYFTDESGKRMLELYDSQFSTAAKIAFSHISLSGTFLTKFLYFHIQDLSTNTNVCNCFIEGLNKAKSSSQSESAYIAIAAQMVSVARENNEIFGKIENMFPDFLIQFSHIVQNAYDLWNNNNSNNSNLPNWSEISAFRSKFSDIYSNIITSLIWLMKNSSSHSENSSVVENIISEEKLSSFFLNEVMNCQEMWRVSSALLGLTSMIEFTMIDLHQMAQILKTINKSNHQISSKYFALFLKVCAEKSNNKEFKTIWESVTQLYFKNCSVNPKNVNCMTVACIINNGKAKNVSQISEKLFEQIISFNEDKTNLVITLLFDKLTNDKLYEIDDFLLRILNDDEKSIQFKINVIYKSLKRTKCFKSMPKIEEVAIDNFQRGGCELLGYILTHKIPTNFVENPKFLSIYEKFDYESHLVMSLLQLGTILSKEFKNNDEIVSKVLYFSFMYLSESFENIELCRKLIKCASRIWRLINANDKFLLKITFKKIGKERCEKLVRKIERASNVRGKRNITLKTFSPTKIVRKAHSFDPEWQDLTVSDT
ncbi:hypothetical protein TRFO_21529 [Tritrichomonas foetus]|uniref:DUF3730 domain-containing protein n=1 Tax=Tritrichomonas foetus TaxID=1144522 RepID=A0A1J4KDQ9_9EUKA|nr:hypothetical protein TRFO_21529 [Tritrichomonas foetus]|eukprot:OHT09567.1 hypothetical protein TRFO_21529 [Tritrichomonas foetus]